MFQLGRVISRLVDNNVPAEIALRIDPKEKKTRTIRSLRPKLGGNCAYFDYYRDQGMIGALFLLSTLLPSSFTEICVKTVPSYFMPSGNMRIQEAGDFFKDRTTTDTDIFLSPGERSKLSIVFVEGCGTILKKLKKYTPPYTGDTKGHLVYANETPETGRSSTIWDENENMENFVHGVSLINNNTIVVFLRNNNYWLPCERKNKGLLHALKLIAASIVQIRNNLEPFTTETLAQNKDVIDFASAINPDERHGEMGDYMLEGDVSAFNQLLESYIQHTGIMEMSEDETILEMANMVTAAMGDEGHLNANIASCRATIDRYLDNIAAQQRSIEQYQMQILNLQTTKNQIIPAVKTALNMLQKCELVTRFTPTETGINLHIERDTDISNADQFTKTYYVKRNDGRYTRENVKSIEVLNYIFHNKDLALMTRTDMQVSLVNKRVNNNLSYGTPAEKERLIPHPHIMDFNCFGSYNRPISEAFGAGDLLGILEICIEVCSGINWADSPVVNKTIYHVTSKWNKKSVKDLKTGEMISFADVYQRMKEEEAAKKTAAPAAPPAPNTPTA